MLNPSKGRRWTKGISCKWHSSSSVHNENKVFRRDDVANMTDSIKKQTVIERYKTTYRCEKSRLSSVRKADEANISDHLELELELLLLAVLSLSSLLEILHLKRCRHNIGLPHNCLVHPCRLSLRGRTSPLGRGLLSLVCTPRSSNQVRGLYYRAN